MAGRRAGAERVHGDAVLAVEAAAGDLQQIWDSALQDPGSTLPPVQVRALLVVDRFGTLNLNALAAELRASTSATSKVCDRLQQAGFITRTAAADDRRGVVLSLSRAGARLVKWAHAQHSERLATVIEAMSPQGRAALVRGLQEFRGTLRRLE